MNKTLYFKVSFNKDALAKQIYLKYFSIKLLGGLMLKLKLHSFGYLMQRADSLEKTLILEKCEGGRRGDNRG